MPQVEINGGNILITLAVILIVLEGISVLSKGIDAFKKLTGKDKRTQEMEKVNNRLHDLEVWQQAVDLRLKTGNKRFEESGKDTTEILKTLHRIVKHLQSGNDKEKLKETDDKLFEYLVNRGVNPETLQ